MTCSIDADGLFSFRWNGCELSWIVQPLIRWVVTGDFDLRFNVFCFFTTLTCDVGGVYRRNDEQTVVS
jgi:hypothetical protein